MGIAQKVNGQRQAKAIRARSWRLSAAKRRGELIPGVVLRKLASLNLPPRRKDYNKALQALLHEHEQHQ